jgi:tellurite resistance protein TerC
MSVSTEVWLVSLVVLSVVLLADLIIVARRPHTPSIRESTIWVSFYVVFALLFGVGIWVIYGAQPAAEFYGGWLTEYSLSIDNLFVFVIIMSRFAVPQHLQQKVLLIGIVLALVMRGAFIAVGAVMVERFAWVFYVFGAFLIYTAIGFMRHGQDDAGDFKENALIRWSRRVLPMAPGMESSKLLSRINGKWLFSPLIVVLVAIATTDLIFAFDSIPAIYGITLEPYLVFTANVFALMGLRQLYFLLGGLLNRLVYLSLGLAVVLGFIGVKLILEALHKNSLPFINGGRPIEWAPEVPIWLSLSVIVVTLIVTATASLLKTAKDNAKESAKEDAEQAAAMVGDQRGTP